ncbi:PAN2-PAN3 deadenylation complex subunit pan3-like [Amphibalanus amphitrite]|uniref:PAN2-PAN3 deadenylation complex subunit pan3-like n=1 Tax=Amphibalanus amphitrite TaxID=1232801 RepID=UPI001C9259C3|nr:PAN2-PAN3 deadenylation complex subunit pan3-like [Amphibalanus amphitrite]XP_043201420.1 PAN2-PAN3 deadenylation complex subunit pan3-like [Amphibalanus amphitrite]XP_043201422.1 PAN2-PAN3 deadenylation complex subunit pan3-like [Amphibalanus amphitrite]
MDNVFIPFSSSGLPQGSKLSTYLTSRVPDRPELSSALSGLTLSPAGKGRGLGPSARPFTPESTANGSPPQSAAAPAGPATAAGPPGQEAADAAPLFEENVGGTTYYFRAEDAAVQKSAEPPTITPPYTAYVAPPARLSDAQAATHPASFFVSDQLREAILRQQHVLLMQANPQAFPDLPTEVDNYHELCPLEPPGQPHKSSTFGYVTSAYKATNTKSGQCYCLRRIHGLRLSGTKCLQLVALWSKVNHSNLVTLRELFTTKSFGDNSVVMVYDFLPAAETLMARHFSQPPQLNGFADPFQDPSIPRPYSAQKNAVLRQQNALIPEPLIWSYVIQLTGALRQVHSSGLACRVLDPSKILVTGSDRLHINCCGVLDVLLFDNNATNPLAMVPHYQQEDLVSLGKLLLALSCNSLLAVQRDNFSTSISIVERHYSADLKALIMSLLMPPRPRTIEDVMPLIGARFYQQLDTSGRLAERLEDELGREVQNGRLFRLLAKMSAITERPELNLEPSWAETGDRYMLKLFRDYVFHAVTDEGRPFLDMAHVVQCLNKLDAGSSDKICLMSRDMQNVLVATYAELKQCFQRSFQEVFEETLAKEDAAAS